MTPLTVTAAIRKLAVERRKLRGERPATSMVHIALGLDDFRIVETADEPNVIPFPAPLD